MLFAVRCMTQSGAGSWFWLQVTWFLYILQLVCISLPHLEGRSSMLVLLRITVSTDAEQGVVNRWDRILGVSL